MDTHGDLAAGGGLMKEHDSSPALVTAVIIANPTSGVFPRHAADHHDTLAFLREQGWQVDLWLTNGPGDAQRLARQAVEEHMQVVVAAGGDGTINEVIQGLAGSETALGILPTGTVNVWAREMGISLDIVKARTILVNGQRRSIDLGQVNGRYFLLMVGIGFDGEVTQVVERRPFKRLGVVAYALAAVWFGSSYMGFPVTLRVDGAGPVRTRALQIVVGNTQLYGGAFKFTWQARCNDGLLDLCMFHQRGLIGRMIVLRDFVLRREQRLLWISYHTFKEVVIETARPVALQIDGDSAGYTPAVFKVMPGALNVIIPQDAPSELFLPEDEQAS